LEKIKYLEKLIPIGTSIEVVFLSGKFRGKYNTKIAKIDNNKIYVYPPTLNTNAGISKGIKLECLFYNEYGKFMFRTVSLNDEKSNMALLAVKKPKVFLRENLRGYFRVPLDVNISYRLLSCKIFHDHAKFVDIVHFANIIDLSGGGAGISSKHNLSEDQIIEVDFGNFKSDIDPIIAKVVNIKDTASGRIYGIVFLSIKENDRDKLIKYGLQKQIDLRTS